MSSRRPTAPLKEPKEQEELGDFPSPPPLQSLQLVHDQPVTPDSRKPNEKRTFAPPRPLREHVAATPLPHPPNEKTRKGNDKGRNSSHARRSSAHKAKGGKAEKDLDLPLSHLKLDDSRHNNSKSTKPSKNRKAGGSEVETRHRSLNRPHIAPSKHSVSSLDNLVPDAYKHWQVVTKPIHDPFTLCFPLPFGSDYESIIRHFEIVKASVTVIRRPVIGRQGVVVLKWTEDYEAKIVHDFGAEKFEGGTREIKPMYPGLIAVSVNEDDVDLNKLEQEIETNFGIVAELSMTTNKSGTVRFVDTKDAGGALLAGFHKCKHLLPGVSIQFKGMFMRGDEVEEWEVEPDKEWPDHRANMRQARATLINYKEKEKPWTDISMRPLIRRKMDGNREVSLVGGPLVYGMNFESVKDYFMGNYRAVIVEFVPHLNNDDREPRSENDDPANILIVVEARQAADLLSIKEHSIDGFKFYVGLPGSIEITTLPMEERARRFLGRAFQHQFGAVVGFRCVEDEDHKDSYGFACYRITFMHWNAAIRAFKFLSACEGQSFLCWMPDHILVDVQHMETWKPEVKESKQEIDD